jgi:hypothetical protein
MSLSVLLFSAFLAFTAFCSARPVGDKISPLENEGNLSMSLPRGLQEIKPWDIGRTTRLSADIFTRKVAVRATCSSAQRQDVKDCVDKCSTRCGSQCCATKSGNIVVVCSPDCCLNYDTQTEDFVTPTYKCTTDSETSSGTGSGSVGGTGSSSSGENSLRSADSGGTANRRRVLPLRPDPKVLQLLQVRFQGKELALEPTPLSSSNQGFKSVWTNLLLAIASRSALISILTFSCSRTKLLQ